MKVIRYLDDRGKELREIPFSEEELLRGYRALRRARHFDERAIVLQRQGKLGVYPPIRGQEAAQVGSVLALSEGDWVVPSYRETGAALTHGLPLRDLVLYWRAHPAGWRYPEGLRLLPFYIPIATQLPQAVGLAKAGQLRGQNWAVLTFIGDGGSSEGDFHEALNFASVFTAPVLFVVQNNGWAISVPTHKQMKATNVASRAAGYDMPGIVVDGNDLIAVWAASREAVQRAKAGQGPTLLEAMTYRLFPHTTSDDPSRYRDESQTQAWMKKEPVGRMQTYLKNQGLWNDEQETVYLAELDQQLIEAVEAADQVPEPEPWIIVEEVYAEPYPDQRAAWEVLHADH